VGKLYSETRYPGRLAFSVAKSVLCRKSAGDVGLKELVRLVVRGLCIVD
jgi:hypothetical protein